MAAREEKAFVTCYSNGPGSCFPDWGIGQASWIRFCACRGERLYTCGRHARSQLSTLNVRRLRRLPSVA